MTFIRLQKTPETRILSRRKVDLPIRQGRVTFNGRSAIIGERVF